METMFGTVFAEFTDKNGKYISVWSDADLDGYYYVASEEIKAEVKFSGGCAWCFESEELSKVLEVFTAIVKNSEENNGVINSQWVVDTYGKGSC